MHPNDELTLETLLTDPLTRLVMRSDNLTAEETARVFRDARRAIDARTSAPASFWHRLRPMPYGQG